MKKFMQFLKNSLKAIKIYENSKLFFMAPLVIILVALICGTVFQLSPKYEGFANIGVDFQGGTRLNVEMEGADMNTVNREYNTEIIENVLNKYGFEVATVQASGESALVVRYSYVAFGNDPTRDAINYGADDMTAEMNAINDRIQNDIKQAFINDERYKDQNITINTSASMIGTSSSMRLLRSALIATAVALAVMLIYIIFRFDIFSALSFIIALMHDVIMMMALMVIFRVEIGSTIVAGIITIISYSINNTIVVFDRIRENVLPYKKGNKRYDMALIVNDSIISTFTRMVYTSLTTLITISVLAIMGVSVIKIFALPIIFGLLAGFYSSAFIAAPLWGLMVETKENNKRKRMSTNTPLSRDKFKRKKVTKFAN